jgi:hypothetical protein
VKGADHSLVQHADAAARDRAHGELLVAGNPQLANDEDVERHVERDRHLERHRHPAARQAEDEHVRPAGVRGQFGGQLPAGVDSVAVPGRHAGVASHRRPRGAGRTWSLARTTARPRRRNRSRRSGGRA